MGDAGENRPAVVQPGEEEGMDDFLHLSLTGFLLPVNCSDLDKTRMHHFLDVLVNGEF